MRKELTRTKQALDKETVRKIIETTAYGVLSLNGDDGYLYTNAGAVLLCKCTKSGEFFSRIGDGLQSAPNENALEKELMKALI